MKKFFSCLLTGLLFATAAFGQQSVPGPNSAQRLGANWAFATVTLDGSSDTLVAAGTGVCKSLIVVNPSGNGTIYIDLSGGTAASTRGIPVAAGGFISFTGAMAPCSKVTVLGTNTNIVQLWTSP